MGYSGLAEIQGRRTDEWVVETLVDIAEPSAYFSALAHASTKAFREIKDKAVRRHAFLAVGFARERTDGLLYPVLLTISNALDENLRWSNTAEGDFALRLLRLDSLASTRSVG